MSWELACQAAEAGWEMSTIGLSREGNWKRNGSGCRFTFGRTGPRKDLINLPQTVACVALHQAKEISDSVVAGARAYQLRA